MSNNDVLLNVEMSIDLKVLREQKRKLVDICSEDDNSILYGLVHMIDAIQDNAHLINGIHSDIVFEKEED